MICRGVVCNHRPFCIWVAILIVLFVSVSNPFCFCLKWSSSARCFPGTSFTIIKPFSKKPAKNKIAFYYCLSKTAQEEKSSAFLHLHVFTAVVFYRKWSCLATAPLTWVNVFVLLWLSGWSIPGDVSSRVLCVVSWQQKQHCTVFFLYHLVYWMSSHWLLLNKGGGPIKEVIGSFSCKFTGYYYSFSASSFSVNWCPTHEGNTSLETGQRPLGNLQSLGKHLWPQVKEAPNKQIIKTVRHHKSCSCAVC